MRKGNSYYVLLSMLLAITLILSFSGCDLFWKETYTFISGASEDIYISPKLTTASWDPFYLAPNDTIVIEVPMSEHVYLNYTKPSTNIAYIEIRDNTTFYFW